MNTAVSFFMKEKTTCLEIEKKIDNFAASVPDFSFVLPIQLYHYFPHANSDRLLRRGMTPGRV